MQLFDRNLFNRFIIDNQVVGFFDEEVILKSGRRSRWYINWRKISSDVFLTDVLSDHLLNFISDNNLKPDAILGVPEGATKLCVLATYKMAKSKPDFAAGKYSLPMGRGKPKEHGVPKDRFFVGEPKGKIVVVEDVTTTGGSLIKTIEILKSMNVEILAAISLANRMEKRDDGLSVEEAISKMGVKYLAMSEATDFLPVVCRTFSPNKEIISSIEEEFVKYGVKEIVLKM